MAMAMTAKFTMRAMASTSKMGTTTAMVGGKGTAEAMGSPGWSTGIVCGCF
jgi:hypothetical protein